MSPQVRTEGNVLGAGLLRTRTVKCATSVAIVAVALLTFSMSEGVEARTLAKSVGAGKTPKARVSIPRLSYPRNLRYQITAMPRKQLKIESGVKCEDGPSVSVKWEDWTSLPKIERSVKLPLSKPVRCSVSVYARYRSPQSGRIVIVLFGRTGRRDGSAVSR
jgi:hypothetical protein